MNILITGGAGFIGSNAVEYFLGKNHNIIVIDNLLSGHYKNISKLVDEKKITYYEADIRDKETVEKIVLQHGIDICINFAALISVAESTEKPLLTEDINVNGLINVLEACGKNKIKTFVHASSAAVYGDSQELPKRETMAPEPKSPYAVTKLAGEYYNTFFADKYGFKAINCRFFNVFGPRQDPKSQYAAAIPIFLERAIANKDITIYGDGEQTRDFIYVKDLISAIDHLIQNTPEEKVNAFNLGYGEFITINEIVKKIITMTGSKSKLLYTDPRPGDIKYSYASIDNLAGTKWQKQTGFDRGLEDTKDYFENLK